MCLLQKELHDVAEKLPITTTENVNSQKRFK